MDQEAIYKRDVVLQCYTAGITLPLFHELISARVISCQYGI